MPRFKFVNLKGDLFATGLSTAGQSAIKLISSLILTRILRPDAYGIITILMSMIFIVGMLSDIGISVSIVRDKNAEAPNYLNTAWTLRLCRAFLNGAIIFLSAPIIASLYDLPTLTEPLRIFSLWFIIDGFESTSFPIAIRRKNSRIIMYSELAATVVSTVFTIVYCYFSRDYWGMVYGALLNRLVLILLSHCYYRELRPRLQLDWVVAREMSRYTRYVMPSSVITLLLSQYDKAALLRFFDLRLLGVYGLAANIAAPVESLISKVSQMVLYPRCAQDFRDNPDTFSLKYYTGNTKLFIGILALPAAIGGAAHLLVTVLYDPRYAQAGAILQAFMLRAVLLSLASPAEDMLIASGEARVVLIGNLFRAFWIVIASLIGMHFFGFIGFAYGIALSGVPPLLYYFWVQHRKGFLRFRYEIYKVVFTSAVAIVAHLTSSFLEKISHTAHLRI